MFKQKVFIIAVSLLLVLSFTFSVNVQAQETNDEAQLASLLSSLGDQLRVLNLQVQELLRARPDGYASSNLAAVINSFSTSPTSISSGGSVTLSWDVTGASSGSISYDCLAGITVRTASATLGCGVDNNVTDATQVAVFIDNAYSSPQTVRFIAKADGVSIKADGNPATVTVDVGPAAVTVTPSPSPTPTPTPTVSSLATLVSISSPLSQIARGEYLRIDYNGAANYAHALIRFKDPNGAELSYLEVTSNLRAAGYFSFQVAPTLAAGLYTIEGQVCENQPNWWLAQYCSPIRSTTVGVITPAAVTVTPSPSPTVSLVADRTSGPAPLTINFTATLYNLLSCGNTYTWSFGTGLVFAVAETCAAPGTILPIRTISKSQTYNAAGTYRAQLSVNNTTSNEVIITVTTGTIPVSGTAPVLQGITLSPNSFNQNPLGGITNVQVTFVSPANYTRFELIGPGGVSWNPVYTALVNPSPYPLAVSSGIALGSYPVKAKACNDSNQCSREVSATLTVMAPVVTPTPTTIPTPIPVTGRNLTVDPITVSSEPGVIRVPFAFNAVIKNNGTENIGSFRTQYALRGPAGNVGLPGLYDISSLAVGATNAIPSSLVTFAVSDPGDYLFEVCADINDDIIEADNSRADNCKRKTLTVVSSVAAARPQITDFKVSGPTSVVPATSATIISGDAVTFATQTSGSGATGAIFRCVNSNRQVIISVGGIEYCGPQGDGPWQIPASIGSIVISLFPGVTSKTFQIELALTDSLGITQSAPYPSVSITVNPRTAAAGVTPIPPIQKTITVTVPNNGGKYYRGSVMPIRWTSTGDISQVGIDTSGLSVIQVSGAVSNSDGFYQWIIPATAPLGNYKIRVRALNESSPVIDESDVSFTIATLPPTVSIPNMVGDNFALITESPTQVSGESGFVTFPAIRVGETLLFNWARPFVRAGSAQGITQIKWSYDCGTVTLEGWNCGTQYAMALGTPVSMRVSSASGPAPSLTLNVHAAGADGVFSTSRLISLTVAPGSVAVVRPPVPVTGGGGDSAAGQGGPPGPSADTPETGGFAPGPTGGIVGGPGGTTGGAQQGGFGGVEGTGATASSLRRMGGPLDPDISAANLTPTQKAQVQQCLINLGFIDTSKYSNFAIGQFIGRLDNSFSTDGYKNPTLAAVNAFQRTYIPDVLDRIAVKTNNPAARNGTSFVGPATVGKMLEFDTCREVVGAPLTGSVPPAPPPSGVAVPSPDKLFFTINGVSTTTVDSGATSTLRVYLPPGINIASASLGCLNNTTNDVSLFYQGGIYCGDMRPTNLRPNGPYSINTQLFPAEIKLVNNTGFTSPEVAIQLTTFSPLQVGGFSTFEIKRYTVGVTVRAPGAPAVSTTPTGVVQPNPTRASPLISGSFLKTSGEREPFINAEPRAPHLLNPSFFHASLLGGSGFFTGNSILETQASGSIVFEWNKVADATSYWYSSNLSKFPDSNSYQWLRLDTIPRIADRGEYIELTMPVGSFPQGEHWFQITACGSNIPQDCARSDTGYPFLFTRVKITNIAGQAPTSLRLAVQVAPNYFFLTPAQSNIVLAGEFTIFNSGNSVADIHGFTLGIPSLSGFNVRPEFSFVCDDTGPDTGNCVYGYIYQDRLRFSLSNKRIFPGGDQTFRASLYLQSNRPLAVSEVDTLLGGVLNFTLMEVESNGAVINRLPLLVGATALISPDYQNPSLSFESQDRSMLNGFVSAGISNQAIIDFMIRFWGGDFQRVFRAAVSTNLPIGEVVNVFKEQGYLRQAVRAALRVGANPVAVMGALQKAGVSYDEIRQLQDYFNVLDSSFRTILNQAGYNADIYFGSTVRISGFHLSHHLSYLIWQRYTADPEFSRQYSRLVFKTVYVVPPRAEPQPQWQEGLATMMYEVAKFYRRELRQAVDVQYRVLPLPVFGEISSGSRYGDCESSRDDVVKEVIRRAFRRTGDYYDASFSQRGPEDFDVIVVVIQDNSGGCGQIVKNNNEYARDDVSPESFFGRAVLHTQGNNDFARVINAGPADSLPFTFYLALHEIGHSLGLVHSWNVVENNLGSLISGSFHDVPGHVMAYAYGPTLRPEDYFFPDSEMNLLLGRSILTQTLRIEPSHSDPVPMTAPSTINNIISYINTESVLRQVPDGLIIRSLLGSGADPKDIITAYQTMSGGGIDRLIRGAREGGISQEQIVIALWRAGFTLAQLRSSIIRAPLDYVDVEEILRRNNYLAPSPPSPTPPGWSEPPSVPRG